MKKVLLFTMHIGLVPVALFAQQADTKQQGSLVFTDVTVIDATGAPAKPHMTVVIKGDRIAALGKTAKLDVPEGANVVNATGKFLIPGLWDMHVHWWYKDFLAVFPANGVTGMRVMFGGPEHHQWRKEISAGQLIGPRMVIARGIAVSNEEEGRRAVRELKKEGADLVKVVARIPRDAYFAITDEAKKREIPLFGHVPYSVSAAEVSDAGQHIEHCTELLMACSTSGEEQLRKKFLEAWQIGEPAAISKVLGDVTYSEQKAVELFTRFVKNGTWVCPTLTVWSELLFRDEEDLAHDRRFKFIPLIKKIWWNSADNIRTAIATGDRRANLRKFYQKKLDIVGAMMRAGVGLLAGTDVDNPYCFPGFSLHDELALLVRAGLSPMEALQTATYNPAKFLGELDSMGTIEKGKVADLVLLEANPLQDIRNTQKIVAVVFGGKIFDKATLQKMFAQIEAVRFGRAAAYAEIEHVKSIIAEGADVNARDQQGWTPLHHACWKNRKETVEFLLAKGADLNAKDENGRNPLAVAKREGHTEIAELLHRRGAKE